MAHAPALPGCAAQRSSSAAGSGMALGTARCRINIGASRDKHHAGDRQLQRGVSTRGQTPLGAMVVHSWGVSITLPAFASTVYAVAPWRQLSTFETAPFWYSTPA